MKNRQRTGKRIRFPHIAYVSGFENVSDLMVYTSTVVGRVLHIIRNPLCPVEDGKITFYTNITQSQCPKFQFYSYGDRVSFLERENSRFQIKTASGKWVIQYELSNYSECLRDHFFITPPFIIEISGKSETYFMSAGNINSYTIAKRYISKILRGSELQIPQNTEDEKREFNKEIIVNLRRPETEQTVPEMKQEEVESDVDDDEIVFEDESTEVPQEVPIKKTENVLPIYPLDKEFEKEFPTISACYSDILKFVGARPRYRIDCETFTAIIPTTTTANALGSPEEKKRIDFRIVGQSILYFHDKRIAHILCGIGRLSHPHNVLNVYGYKECPPDILESGTGALNLSSPVFESIISANSNAEDMKLLIYCLNVFNIPHFDFLPLTHREIDKMVYKDYEKIMLTSVYDRSVAGILDKSFRAIEGIVNKDITKNAVGVMRDRTMVETRNLLKSQMKYNKIPLEPYDGVINFLIDTYRDMFELVNLDEQRYFYTLGLTEAKSVDRDKSIRIYTFFGNVHNDEDGQEENIYDEFLVSFNKCIQTDSNGISYAIPYSANKDANNDMVFKSDFLRGEGSVGNEIIEKMKRWSDPLALPVSRTPNIRLNKKHVISDSNMKYVKTFDEIGDEEFLKHIKLSPYVQYEWCIKRINEKENIRKQLVAVQEQFAGVDPNSEKHKQFGTKLTELQTLYDNAPVENIYYKKLAEKYENMCFYKLTGEEKQAVENIVEGRNGRNFHIDKFSGIYFNSCLEKSPPYLLLGVTHFRGSIFSGEASVVATRLNIKYDLSRNTTNPKKDVVFGLIFRQLEAVRHVETRTQRTNYAVAMEYISYKSAVGKSVDSKSLAKISRDFTISNLNAIAVENRYPSTNSRTIAISDYNVLSYHEKVFALLRNWRTLLPQCYVVNSGQRGMAKTSLDLNRRNQQF